MLSCPACGAANDADARFCSTCGVSLRPACAACGAQLPDGAGFCPACGTAVHREDAAETLDERRVVSVLFADVAGSTTIGERLDPEQLREVLATYFGAMREEIEAEGGTVEKFIGDAVMAAFGVPVAHEDDPARALRSSLRMRHRLAAVNAELATSHDLSLRMRIGVNTGQVLATGGAAPGEPMVTGDVVNTAARLQSAAEPDEILAAERTRRAVRGFRFGERRDLTLKGRSEPVTASPVLGGSGEAADVGLSASMVGRDVELVLLQTMFRRSAVERRPHVVTIYGDPGVGKSRLTREFVRWAKTQDEDPRVLRGRCLPYGDGITYWPLSEILRGVAGIADTDPPTMALGKIREVGRSLLAGAAEPARATAALAFTTGLEDPDVPLSGVEPKQVRMQIHAAWRVFFSTLAVERPLIVVVEDIHWADPAMLDLLEELADRVEGGVSFVCPSRPELTGSRPEWGGGKRNYSAIALDPLGEHDADQLVRSLLDVEALPDSVHHRILAKAEGNPFFLEEIVRQLVDNGSVRFEDGRWRATDEVAQVAIPDTVQGVLAARIDLLEPPHRRVLQAAAVVGRVFWPSAVSRLLDGHSASLSDALAVLEERDLVRARLASSLGSESEFTFKHVLTRDVAYETLPVRDRSAAHAAVATWLEDTLGGRAPEFAELLAYHWFSAHRSATGAGAADVESLRRKAFHRTLQAAQDAGRRFAVRTAERLAAQAIDLAASPHERSLAYEQSADAFFNDLEGDEAWRGFTTAAEAELDGDSPDPVRIADLCAKGVDIATRWLGSMRVAPSEPEVRRYLEIGLAHLPPGDSRERVQLLGDQASWPFAFPSFEFSDEELDRIEADGLEASEVADRLGDADLTSAALDKAVAPSMRRGRYGRALEIEARRLPLIPQLSDPVEVGDVYAMMAWCSGESGRWSDLVRYASDGEAAVGVAINSRLHVLAWLTEGRFRVGDWDGAIRSFDETLTMLEDRRDDPPYYACNAFATAALIHTLRAERAEGDRLLDLLRRIEGDAGRSMSLRVWPYVSRLLVARGSLDEAWHRFQDRPSGWRLAGATHFEAMCEWVPAAHAWERADEIVREVRAAADDGDLVGSRLHADRLAGLTACHDGAIEDGVRDLERARAGFLEHGAAWEVARTDLAIAEVLGLGRLDDESRRRLQAAAALFENLGSVEELRRARALTDGPGNQRSGDERE
ncbi:MAG: adenylate/guanylate cyclase domain-containing protein [Actinomycetota bacterium]